MTVGPGILLKFLRTVRTQVRAHGPGAPAAAVQLGAEAGVAPARGAHRRQHPCSGSCGEAPAPLCSSHGVTAVARAAQRVLMGRRRVARHVEHRHGRMCNGTGETGLSGAARRSGVRAAQVCAVAGAAHSLFREGGQGSGLAVFENVDPRGELGSTEGM
jgi:hypothetical protein